MDRSNPGARVEAHHSEPRGLARIGYPIRVRTLQVLDRVEVTPAMVRLTLGGPGLAGFESHAADDHVKIVFPLEDGTRADPVANDHDELDWPELHAPCRKYTVRRYDPQRGEIDLDFVLHGGGLASEWVREVALGEDVVVAGPPGAKAFAHGYRHFIFALDVTGLPALARWLDEAAAWWEQAGATADVLIDYDDEAETSYPLAVPAGVSVRWLSRTAGSRLAAEVADLDLAGVEAADVIVVANGEADDIKPLRRWAKAAGHDALITGYWRRGVAGLED